MRLPRFAWKSVLATAAAVRYESTCGSLKLGGATPNSSTDVCGRQYLPLNSHWGHRLLVQEPARYPQRWR